MFVSSDVWFLVSSFSSHSLTLFLSHYSCHTHTHTLSPFFFSLVSFHVFLLLSSQSAFLQLATEFTPLPLLFSELWLLLLITGTLRCDVARCPTAALHNPMRRLCWLHWPVFTQAPRACHDPADATLRGCLAVHAVIHGGALKGRSWCFELPNTPMAHFSCNVVL